MKDIIKIAKSLEDSGLLFKGFSETIQNEVKEQRGGFLSMLLGTLGTSLLGNILAGKGINRAGEGIVRADYGKKDKICFYDLVFFSHNQLLQFLMPPHPLTNFEIKKYYQNKPRFISRDNLPGIKDGHI